jgi:glutamate racemase
MAVRKVVEPLLVEDIDKIVLGCTHYPFLRPLIESVIGDRDIEVIDSGEAVARRVKWLLERYDIAQSEGATPEFKFLTFADEEYRGRLELKAQTIERELTNEK